jgi:hypothetical protein
VKRTILCIIAAVSVSAETRQERGARAVKEALAALGGDRFLEMKDRVEAGRAYSFYREQLSGLARATIYTRYLETPEAGVALRERQSFGKNEEESAVVFAAGKGWEITFRGARPVPEDRVARWIESNQRSVFYIFRVRLKEPGLIIESQGAEVFQNQPIEIVDITDSENRTTTVYFHSSTKLPVRQAFVRRDPKTRERFEEVTFFSKYRDVGGGVMWPFTIQLERNGEKIFEIYSESVAINQGIGDDKFTLPGGVKVLPPKR